MFSRQTALIAEESVRIQRIVSQILDNSLNFGRVLVAGDSKEAVDVVKRHQVEWIFCNWSLSPKGGLDLKQELNRYPSYRNIPFILMTGQTDRKTLEEAIIAGVSDFIAMPFSSSVLVRKVQRIKNATEKNVAARISTTGHFPALIAYGNGASYEAELVDISESGCLLRGVPPKRGGTVYDEAALTFKLKDKITIRGVTARIAMDHDSSSGEKKTLMAFQFNAEGEALNAIKLFISQQQVNESGAGQEPEQGKKPEAGGSSSPAAGSDVNDDLLNDWA